MGTLPGEVTQAFSYLLPCEGFTFKGTDLQILSFKSKPNFGRGSNRKSQKFFPLINMAAKHERIPTHLNIFYWGGVE